MGQILQEMVPGLSVFMSSRTESPNAPTVNIFAQKKGDSSKPIVMLGSHLDSVLAGPGINDNGSGSSTNLELAIQVAKLDLEFENRIVFAWWGAEEYGLLGSEYYVDNANNDTLKEIALYLNFDMLGSPNFFRQIHNGTTANQAGRLGSEKIQGVFQEYFDSRNLTTDLTPMSGGSDYYPFVGVGIPAGGLATGASRIKDAAGRTKFGGWANVALDPCYHQACDTLDNINRNVLLDMAKAAAYTLSSLADQENLVEFLTS